MTWQEIYNKYKDTELMQEFVEPFYEDSDWDKIEYWNIKDIYGYLFCFAKSEYDYDLEKIIIGSFNVDTPEKLMIYRTNKFFEVTE